MQFERLGLHPKLLDAVFESGFKIPTAIQQKAIPAILGQRDVLGGAQTGTGKTAAFALPVLQRLNQHEIRSPYPRALVLSPTRELAAQVHESFVQFGKNLSLRSLVVFGGVGARPQIEKLKRGIDVLVACPGRLLDLAASGHVGLSRVQILVLDEADRMLDMGFIHDIRRILKLLPQKRQSLLFSATYSNEIRKLAGTVLHNPKTIDVSGGNNTVGTVHQVVHQVSRQQKTHLLIELLNSDPRNRTLVFTRTKHGANRLTGQLQKAGVQAAAIHGNKSQTARAKALSEFKKGNIRVLVATDIAARGLDIEQLPHVVNFELPHVPLDYIHRIGRTGRAGRHGRAVSLVSAEEQPLLAAIEKVIERRIPVENFKNSCLQ